jgi:SAM-dependent methyltransferase
MMLDDSDWSHKAWMSVPDADLFEQILLRKAAEPAAPLRVLEWGAGKSTRYFSGLLRERDRPFHWLSLEYDRAFFHKDIEPAVGPDWRVTLVDRDRRRASGPERPLVDLVIFDYGTLRPYMEAQAQDRLVVMDDYVQYPSQQGAKFDVILVDGRKRRQCLLEASRLLAPNGVAVLHDAQRDYYHCAFSSFRTQRRIGELLWAGTQSDQRYFDSLTAP